MDILAYGDTALLINFEQTIDPLINARVIALDRALKEAPPVGIRYTIPAYCSLTVVFDPAVQSLENLKRIIAELPESNDPLQGKAGGRRLTIPVCYEGDFAPDLEAVCRQLNLSADELIRLHCSIRYQVYMLGFLPGFAYMGKLPEALACSRKEVPRLRVPARSVGLAGRQTGIYPAEGPGGWQIIGQTPVEVFDPNLPAPFLFQPGDLVRFNPITAANYQEVRQSIAADQFTLSSLYE